jgi:hypothetical protein
MHMFARSRRLIRSLAREFATRPIDRSSCYVYTIKKSGTHLVRNVLMELGQACLDCLAPGTAERVGPSATPTSTFLLSLERPTLGWRAACQQGDVKLVFNIRDPRAVLLSLLDFYDWEVPLRSPGLHTVEFRRAACREAFKSREALGLAILDDETLDDDPFTPWLNFRRSRALFHHPGVFKVRFEDLAAGADPSPRVEDHPVTVLCRHLGLRPPPHPHEVVRRAFASGSITKNVGAADRWRTALPPSLLEAFMAKHGDIVREYGYPEE